MSREEGPRGMMGVQQLRFKRHSPVKGLLVSATWVTSHSILEVSSRIDRLQHRIADGRQSSADVFGGHQHLLKQQRVLRASLADFMELVMFFSQMKTGKCSSLMIQQGYKGDERRLS